MRRGFALARRDVFSFITLPHPKQNRRVPHQKNTVDPWVWFRRGESSPVTSKYIELSVLFRWAQVMSINLLKLFKLRGSRLDVQSAPPVIGRPHDIVNIFRNLYDMEVSGAIHEHACPCHGGDLRVHGPSISPWRCYYPLESRNSHQGRRHHGLLVPG